MGYEAGFSVLIKEDTSALSYLLDELFLNYACKDNSRSIETLVAALASRNHCPEAQTTLIAEIKNALQRVLSIQTDSKHNNSSESKQFKLQALAGLISTMIDSSTASQTGP